MLAEAASTKRKYLYVLNKEHPLHFFNGGRSLDSVMSRNVKLLNDLSTRHGDKYKKVSEYYLAHRYLVAVEDVSAWLPQLVSETPEVEEEDVGASV